MNDCLHCTSGRRDFIKIAFGGSAAGALSGKFYLPSYAATKPAKAPMVICEASAKLVKRSTAKITVSPIAGKARMVPDIRPLRRSWMISIYLSGRNRRQARV